MPFETLPGSQFQLPSIPWQAPQVGPHDYEPRNPGLMLAALDKSMSNLTEAIKDMSPIERAKREMQIKMLQFKRDNWAAAEKNPSAYTWTETGPVPKDAYTVQSQAANLKLLGQRVIEGNRKIKIANDQDRGIDVLEETRQGFLKGRTKPKPANAPVVPQSGTPRTDAPVPVSSYEDDLKKQQDEYRVTPADETKYSAADSPPEGDPFEIPEMIA